MIGNDGYVICGPFYYFVTTTKNTIPKKLVVAEVNKCALLCANCHRAYESGEWHGHWEKRDGLGWELKPIYDGS